MPLFREVVLLLIVNREVATIKLGQLLFKLLHFGAGEEVGEFLIDLLVYLIRSGGDGDAFVRGLGTANMLFAFESADVFLLLHP